MVKQFLIFCLAVLTVVASGRPSQAQQAGACPIFGPKAVAGAAVGTALGAGIGSAITRGKGSGGLIIGGLAGGALGGSVGASLDQQDCIAAQQALQRMTTQRTGQQIPWANQASGNHGALTPTSNVAKASNGQVCRNYHIDSITKDGTTQSHDGVTCEQPNGDWQALS